jgi:hypothetical protein
VDKVTEDGKKLGLANGRDLCNTAFGLQLVTVKPQQSANISATTWTLWSVDVLCRQLSYAGISGEIFCPKILFLICNKDWTKNVYSLPSQDLLLLRCTKFQCISGVVLSNPLPCTEKFSQNPSNLSKQ